MRHVGASLPFDVRICSSGLLMLSFLVICYVGFLVSSCREVTADGMIIQSIGLGYVCPPKLNFYSNGPFFKWPGLDETDPQQFSVRG
jgi:hypothetical protein